MSDQKRTLTGKLPPLSELVPGRRSPPSAPASSEARPLNPGRLPPLADIVPPSRPVPADVGQAMVAASMPSLPAASQALVLGELEHPTPSESSPLGRKLLKLVERVRTACEGASDERRAKFVPLTFAAYLRALGKIDVIRRALYRGDGYVPEDSPELRRFADDLFKPDSHTPDLGGYVRYVGSVNEELADEIALELDGSAPVLAEEVRQRHTAIAGGSGSGKSELMKLLLHHYVRHPELGGVLLLDPHGEVAWQAAHWREFAGRGAERLVYLDGMARPGMAPAINPLDVATVSDQETADVADQMAAAIGLMGGESGSLSDNMLREATFCLKVLLERPGSTFSDLQDLLEATGDARLLREAMEHHNPVVARHFKGSFQKSALDSAKEGLIRRIEGILGRPAFCAMLTGAQPLDLLAELDAGKVVLVNLASAGRSGDVALGRLLMAQVAALGMRRVYRRDAPRTPVHVFVDEATKLMAPPVFEILAELRKAGIHLTMVQQVFADGMNPAETARFVQNTQIKMVGGGDGLGQTLKAMGWGEQKNLPKLAQGEFIIQWGSDNDRMTLKIAQHLLKDGNSMSAEQWEKVLEGQLKAYHRPVPERRAKRPGADQAPETSAEDTWAHWDGH